MDKVRSFTGAKMALYLGDKLAVILRDETPGLVYPGCWDFPGGGREGRETAFECVQRECFEELGLQVSEGDLLWRYWFVSAGRERCFFVARLPAEAADRVVFGNDRAGLLAQGLAFEFSLQSTAVVQADKATDAIFPQGALGGVEVVLHAPLDSRVDINLQFEVDTATQV